MPKDLEYKDFDIVREGYKASAVPGTVAGLLDAHANFGKLPLDEILEPVIKQAREGIRVTYDLSKAIESTSQLGNDSESKRIYFKNNAPLKEGSLMKRPDLADTIQKISEEGKSGFYSGDIAKAFIKAMELNGGFFTLDDFKNYKANISSPIVASYRDHLVFTAGPPSGGGVFINCFKYIKYF